MIQLLLIPALVILFLIALLTDDGNDTTASIFTLISNGTIVINDTVGGIAPIDRLEANGNGMTEIGANLNVSGGTLLFNTDVLLTNTVSFSDSGTSGIFLMGMWRPMVTETMA